MVLLTADTLAAALTRAQRSHAICDVHEGGVTPARPASIRAFAEVVLAALDATPGAIEGDERTAPVRSANDVLRAVAEGMERRAAVERVPASAGRRTRPRLR